MWKVRHSGKTDELQEISIAMVRLVCGICDSIYL